ncbi:hypothetical protein HAX54_043083 [Datura stramonium]|uniref:Uncharacterized protein n=1 Tax=Datura stramonium TaxID=4076 RepID=A0ABS8W539_DATST|nr:hypothetical protein [Datura stramonium]
MIVLSKSNNSSNVAMLLFSIKKQFGFSREILGLANIKMQSCKVYVSKKTTGHVILALATKTGIAEAVDCDPSSPNGAGVPSATGHLYPDPDSVQSVPGSTLAPPALLQFAKSRKLSVER